MPLIIPDDDQHDTPDGPPFKVFIFIPEFVKRMIGRLVRLLSRRRVE